MNFSDIDKAKAGFRKGNVAAVDEVFDKFISEKSEKLAIAANASGEIAEGRLDWKKAMKRFTLAHTLSPENKRYSDNFDRMSLLISPK